MEGVIKNVFNNLEVAKCELEDKIEDERIISDGAERKEQSSGKMVEEQEQKEAKQCFVRFRVGIH